MKTIIILYTLAMIQGFLDAKINPADCRTEIIEVFEKLEVDLVSTVRVSGLIGKCKSNINSLINTVQTKIDESNANDKNCLNGLSMRLDKINASYAANLDAYDKEVEEQEVGKHIAKFGVSLSECIDKSLNCSDIPSCYEEFKNILYSDGTVTKGDINAFLIEYQSDFPRACDANKNEVNEIEGDIAKCA